MSLVTIPTVLETKLAEITPSIATAYPNAAFKPTEGTPFQQVSIIYAKPDNDFIHRGYLQRGYMQVTLYYPLLQGPLNIRTRAQLIRDKFKSGSVFSGVKITSTPEIGSERSEADRFVVPVFVYFMEYNSEA